MMIKRDYPHASLEVRSELSEILSSLWGAALIALGYFGPNKLVFDGIRDLDDAGFARAIISSLADAGVEALLFVSLASYLYITLGVRAIPSFATYIKAAKMTVPFTAVCVLTPVVSLYFFMEHHGVDATFRFAWLRERGGEECRQDADRVQCGRAARPLQPSLLGREFGSD